MGSATLTNQVTNQPITNVEEDVVVTEVVAKPQEGGDLGAQIPAIAERLRGKTQLTKENSFPKKNQRQTGQTDIFAPPS